MIAAQNKLLAKPLKINLHKVNADSYLEFIFVWRAEQRSAASGPVRIIGIKTRCFYFRSECNVLSYSWIGFIVLLNLIF